MTTEGKIALWFAQGRRGASSECIAAVMLGAKSDGSYPHDGGDFGRCEALLDAVPELRERMGEMAKVNRYWAALVPAWESIRTAPDRTDALRAILRPIEKADSRVFHMDVGTLRFGQP